ncbi:MAG: hypothetical protein AAAC47_08860 [Pararhizobium sp.]
MSNIIAFPITHPGDVATLAIGINLEEGLEDVCDRIEDISNWLIAIHDELAKAIRTSVSLPETASTNRPAEQSWS